MGKIRVRLDLSRLNRSQAGLIRGWTTAGGEFAPVRENKVWFWTVSATTNRQVQHFLYDLKNRRVIGELIDANPVFANGDQTKLLCEGYSAIEEIEWKVIRWLEKSKIAKGLSGRLAYDQYFWILDLKDNSAVKIGKVSQCPGTGSYFIPAPGFRFGYNRPTVNPGFDVAVCDLQSNRFWKAKIGGEPWDGGMRKGFC